MVFVKSHEREVALHDTVLESESVSEPDAGIESLDEFEIDF